MVSVKIKGTVKVLKGDPSPNVEISFFIDNALKNTVQLGIVPVNITKSFETTIPNVLEGGHLAKVEIGLANELGFVTIPVEKAFNVDPTKELFDGFEVSRTQQISSPATGVSTEYTLCLFDPVSGFKECKKLFDKIFGDLSSELVTLRVLSSRIKGAILGKPCNELLSGAGISQGVDSDISNMGINACHACFLLSKGWTRVQILAGNLGGQQLERTRYADAKALKATSEFQAFVTEFFATEDTADLGKCYG